MSVAVLIGVHDGVVLAADSASTLTLPAPPGMVLPPGVSSSFVANVYDNDENSFVSGGPSGSQSLGQLFVFLESQRISLLNNGQINPSGFKGGWVDAQFANTGATYLYNPYNVPTARNFNWNMAWVGVQHTAPGAFLSVGHSASELNNQFNCFPPYAPSAADPGTFVYFPGATVPFP